MNSEYSLGKKEIAAILVATVVFAATVSAMVVISHGGDDGKISVVYDSNNGTGEKSSFEWIKYEKLRIYAEDGDMFDNPGYIFYAWCDAADGSGEKYLPGDLIESDVTLYAIWTVDTAAGIMERFIEIYGNNALGPFSMTGESGVREAYSEGAVPEGEVARANIELLLNGKETTQTYAKIVEAYRGMAVLLEYMGIEIIELQTPAGFDEGYGIYHYGASPDDEDVMTVAMYVACKDNVCVALTVFVDYPTTISESELGDMMDSFAEAISQYGSV